MITKPRIQRLSLILADLCALILSLAIAQFLFNLFHPTVVYPTLKNVGMAKLVGSMVLLVFWYQEQYSKRRPIWEELHLLYRTIFVFAIIHLGISYFTAHHVIKFVNILFWGTLLIVLPVLRYFTKLLLLHLNLWLRDVYIIGIQNNAVATYQLLKDNWLLGYNVLGFVDLNNQAHVLVEANTGLPIFDYNVLFSSEHLLIESDTEIIFAVSTAELAEHAHKINLLQTKYAFVSIVPDIAGLPLYDVELNQFFGSDQLFLRLQNNLSRRGSRLMKRSMDIILSSIVLILLSPVFIVIAGLIKCCDGSRGGKILFNHQRISGHNRSFNCLKFRTMHSNSQEILMNLLARDVNAKAEWDKEFKLKNDPRITKLGKWLRKTSLDELPQLFNVLKGDMSLVGPRPIIAEEISKYQDDFYYYQLVRPGITGLWQISGRNDVDYVRRVQLDVWYVKNWSLWYDFVILLKTITTIVRRKGAY